MLNQTIECYIRGYFIDASIVNRRCSSNANRSSCFANSASSLSISRRVKMFGPTSLLSETGLIHRAFRHRLSFLTLRQANEMVAEIVKRVANTIRSLFDTTEAPSRLTGKIIYTDSERCREQRVYINRISGSPQARSPLVQAVLTIA